MLEKILISNMGLIIQLVEGLLAQHALSPDSAGKITLLSQIKSDLTTLEGDVKKLFS